MNMTPTQFVAKWSRIQQKETATAQSHFNDVCALVGHQPPLAFDPTGQQFAFETQTVKPGGQKGFADVFFRDHFIWEYKGPHKDLGKAYAQLQLYREDLHNPPLLITSDIHTIIIHTNFNNYPTVRHTITFDDLLQGDGLEKLRWAFFTPERFTPDKTQAEITKASADTFVAVADAMKKHMEITGETYTAEQLAHFLARLLFCLFAEDLGLLPHNIFSQIVRAQGMEHINLQRGLRNLFHEMRNGGVFGYFDIREFNGTLFDDDFVPTIPDDLARALLQAAQQDWSQVDPAIFGTLFERVIDQEKRAQLGAHYTSVADIMLIVEPVLMAPLRQKWDDLRRQVEREPRQVPGTANSASSEEILEAVPGAAHTLLTDFAAEIAAVRVLDPACGSGNFLYVALRQLLDLQKQVIAYAARRGLPDIPLTVSPEQLYGIEINPYAHELAQITTWIGYLQWRDENGFADIPDPVLRSLHNIRRTDAILAHDTEGNPTEPDWPPTDVIIGNPPFLGAKQMISELTEEYVNQLRSVYHQRLSRFSDLVTYWFERARKEIENGKAKRAGLLATNSIRMGTNLHVLKNIKKSGDIFMAWADREWVLEGAAVRVSMIGFDNGAETNRTLDGQPVATINADLTTRLDLTKAIRLPENVGIAFIGTQRSGPFDISQSQADKMLAVANASGVSNSDVIKRQYNARDITNRPGNVWVIDFDRYSEEEAAKYEMPFAHVQEYVFPVRVQARRKAHQKRWWQLAESREGMKLAMTGKTRYIAAPIHAKHRLFVWVEPDILPDHALTAIARDDDYFFGMLHSRVHQLWALRLGTSLEDRPRYTPTTSFQTFPFPWPPGQEPAESDDPRVAEIAHWARALHRRRETWLNPPLPTAKAIDVTYQKSLQNRTLTNLYNGLVYFRDTRPGISSSITPFNRAEFDKVTRKAVSVHEIEELHDIHTALDHAVLAAYGWPPHLNDEEILERLLALNLERATLGV